MVRRNRIAFAAGVVVAVALLLALGILAVSVSRIIHERNQKDAAFQQRGVALADAKEQLFEALLSRARAGRYSRQMGQRLDSLDALAERLRDEAIAAMALPDVRLGPSWSLDRPDCVDGHCQLSAMLDDKGTIIIRTVPDRREVQRIDSGRPARVLAFSHDGRFLAQQDMDYKLRIWRVADGQSMFGDELGRAKWVFSPDGHHLVLGKRDEVWRYDLATDREINRWRARGKVHALSLHSDNRRLAVGYERSSMVSVFDVTDGAHLADLPVGGVDEQVVAWHPDRRRLAVSGSDPRVHIWDVPAKREIATLEGHVDPVTALAFHPSGSLLTSAGWDAMFRMWEPSSGRPVLQFPYTISLSAFSTDGRWGGAVSKGEGGQLLEVATCPEYRTFVSSLGAGQGGFLEGGVSPDGRLLIVGMNEGVRVWELASGREAAVLEIGRAASAFFQPDGRELLTCGDDGLQRWMIHDRTDAAQPLRLGPPKKIPLPFTPTRACRSRDGKVFAVTSESRGGAHILDAATGAVQSPLLPHPQAGYLALSPDGAWLATGGWHSPLLRLWNVRTSEMVAEWPAAYGIAFTPDSRALVALGLRESGFRDVRTLQRIRALPRDAGAYPTEVAFSSDEKLMAFEFSPGVIHLTEFATGCTVAKLTDPFGDRTTWMSFTPDGTQLVTVANYAKVIHVWDLRRIRARLKTMGLDWEWPEFPRE